MRSRVDDTLNELKRFEDARDAAKEQLDELYNKALSEVGEENAMIFDIHRMMLDDLDFLDSVKSNIIMPPI